MFCGEAWLSQAPKISVVYLSVCFPYHFRNSCPESLLYRNTYTRLVHSDTFLRFDMVDSGTRQCLYRKKKKKKFVGLKLLYSPAFRKKKNKEKEKVKVIERGPIIKKTRKKSHASYRFRSVCHHSRLCICTDSCLDC